jgi:hypothetical protein
MYAMKCQKPMLYVNVGPEGYEPSRGWRPKAAPSNEARVRTCDENVSREAAHGK